MMDKSKVPPRNGKVAMRQGIGRFAGEIGRGGARACGRPHHPNLLSADRGKGVKELRISLSSLMTLIVDGIALRYTI